MGNCCCTPPPVLELDSGACCYIVFRLFANRDYLTQPSQYPLGPVVRYWDYDVMQDGLMDTAYAYYIRNHITDDYVGGALAPNPDLNKDGFVTALDVLNYFNMGTFLVNYVLPYMTEEDQKNKEPTTIRNTHGGFTFYRECVQTDTETECYAKYKTSPTDYIFQLVQKEDPVHGVYTDAFEKYWDVQFTPNAECGDPIQCCGYQTSSGCGCAVETWCNGTTGECTTEQRPSCITFPYHKVKACSDCIQFEPGCCCEYWEDPNGVIPTYNNLFYVYDKSLCSERSFDYKGLTITPTVTFDKTHYTFNGIKSCNPFSSCVDGNGWYCEQELSGFKDCKLFKRDPNLDFPDSTFTGPFPDEETCNQECINLPPGDNPDQGDFNLYLT